MVTIMTFNQSDLSMGIIVMTFNQLDLSMVTWPSSLIYISYITTWANLNPCSSRRVGSEDVASRKVEVGFVGHIPLSKMCCCAEIQITTHIPCWAVCKGAISLQTQRTIKKDTPSTLRQTATRNREVHPDLCTQRAFFCGWSCHEGVGFPWAKLEVHMVYMSSTNEEGEGMSALTDSEVKGSGHRTSLVTNLVQSDILRWGIQ